MPGCSLGEEDGQTPFQKKMAEISKTLSFVCLCVCAVMFGVGLLQGRPMLDMFLTAVSLAVAAIPEGLPAIVTIVLALGVARMARRNAIVQRLPAVETLGCAGGHLLGQDRHADPEPDDRGGRVDGRRSERCRDLALRRIGALCSRCRPGLRRTAAPAGGSHRRSHRDRHWWTPAAWAAGLDKNGLEAEWPRRGELPFDSERKLMTTVHQRPGGGWRVCVKGAPDVLARRCRLDSAAARRLESRNEAMAGKALRVLGVAYKDLAMLPRELNSAALEQGLTFVGLIGMIDPPRPEVRTAVEQCYAAGIKPVMITGDHKLTAVGHRPAAGTFCTRRTSWP
ncbi:MAG: hypothetical protein ACLRWQ_01270 [Flavonifractor plautii]